MVPATFIMQGSWEPCYPPPKPEPFELSFQTDAFEQRFEAKLEEENNIRNTHVWKSFEHYKRSCPSEFLPSTCLLQSDARVPTPFNNCGSYDLAVVKKPLLGWRGYVGGIGQYNPWIALPLFYEPGHGGDDSFVRPPSDLSSLNQHALNFMMPAIRAELSLINSVIELKDFRSLGKTLGGSLGTVIGFFKSKGIRDTTSGTLRQILRSTADGWLQLQFNILPLLKDIQAVMHAMSSVEEQIRKLVNGVGKRQTRHYRFVWDETASTITQSRGPYLLGPGLNFPIEIGSFKWTTNAVATPSVFNAEIQFNYQLTGWEIAHARLLGALDALGINLNPAIIWNAIPWTFLVDWVVSVSSLLNTLKTPNINPTVNITNYCWSILRSRKLYTQFDYWGYHSPGVGPHPVMLPTVDETAYRRQVGLPSTSSLRLSGLSAIETSLGAALLAVRGPTAKRWRFPKYPKPRKPKR